MCCIFVVVLPLSGVLYLCGCFAFITCVVLCGCFAFITCVVFLWLLWLDHVCCIFVVVLSLSGVLYLCG